MITYDEILRLFMEAVIFYPKGDGCSRLETFALVEEYADFNAQSLGKSVRDIGKPYFFSRKWANKKYNPSQLGFDFPLLAMFETTSNVQGFTFKQDVKCYEFELIAMDKYNSDMHQKGCLNRTKQEIYNDTERAVDNVLAYVSDIGYYVNTTYPEGIWLNREHAASLNLTGEQRHISQWWSKMLRTNNETNQQMRWDGGMDDLYGTLRIITLCLKNCPGTDTFTFADSNYTVQNDKSCC